MRVNKHKANAYSKTISFHAGSSDSRVVLWPRHSTGLKALMLKQRGKKTLIESSIQMGAGLEVDTYLREQTIQLSFFTEKEVDNVDEMLNE